MLILILTDNQYLQAFIFSLEKGSNGLNHSSPGLHLRLKKYPQQNFSLPLLGGFPLSINTVWKTLRHKDNFALKLIKNYYLFSMIFPVTQGVCSLKCLLNVEDFSENHVIKC